VNAAERGIAEPRQLVRVPISGQTVLKGGHESVANLLRSPERLWQLTPGCNKIERITADTYRGWIQFGIPGIMGSYTGEMKLDYHSTNHYGMRLMASRADGTGSINAKGSIRLVELNNDSISLSYRGGVEVSWPWSMIGTAGITGFAKLLLGQFFAAAQAELDAEKSGTVVSHSLVRNFCRYLVRSIQ
jgi:2-furoyl-CoA dehydrogenase large subunit